MELRHLRYLVAVVQEGNFTRAAARLHIAQPPLSRQIQQLEGSLDVTLLERRSRPLRPTDAGQLFYEHALDILDRIEVLTIMTKRLGQLEKGRFGIGFVGSTLYGALPDLVRRFRAAHPELRVKLLELTSLQQVAALKNGRIDVGFGRLAIDDPAVKREVLREEPLIVALPIGHPLLDRPSLPRLVNLVAEPLILYPREPRPSYADQILSLFWIYGLEPSNVQEVSGMQTALGLVAAGEGVCIVPEGLQRLRRDDILYRRLDEERAVSPIIMFCRLHDPSREIVLLLDLIRELYAETTEGY
jgi:LysR family transcriptional regulator, benzoate and cis,cis-muconate-responsive activator of ben and cat genes